MKSSNSGNQISVPDIEKFNFLICLAVILLAACLALFLLYKGVRRKRMLVREESTRRRELGHLATRNQKREQKSVRQYANKFYR